jgi:hypothetical protein
MTSVFSLCQWLEQTSVGTAVRESLWLFPVIETVHLFGIVILVGSTSALDLRLLGFAMCEQSVSKLAHRLLPWAWIGFVTQVVTGVLLFSSEATKCYMNLGFQIKMALIVLAGANALLFHSLAYRSVDKWDNAPSAPFMAKFAGCMSILLWFGIVAAGRWIAFL